MPDIDKYRDIFLNIENIEISAISPIFLDIFRYLIKCRRYRGESRQINLGGCKFRMGAVVIKHPRGEAVLGVHFSILAHLNGERQSNTKDVLIYYQLIQIFDTQYTDSSMLPKLI